MPKFHNILKLRELNVNYINGTWVGALLMDLGVLVVGLMIYIFYLIKNKK